MLMKLSFPLIDALPSLFLPCQCGGNEMGFVVEFFCEQACRLTQKGCEQILMTKFSAKMNWSTFGNDPERIP